MVIFFKLKTKNSIHGPIELNVQIYCKFAVQVKCIYDRQVKYCKTAF